MRIQELKIINKIHYKIFLLMFIISIHFSLAQENDIYKGQSTIYYELFGTSGAPYLYNTTEFYLSPLKDTLMLL